MKLFWIDNTREELEVPYESIEVESTAEMWDEIEFQESLDWEEVEILI